MQQLMCTGKHQLEWQDTAAPVIDDPRAAIVRPLAVATCDLDVGILSGRAPVPMPFAFGHECVAEVVEAGADVKTMVAGDRVVVPFQFSCGDCKPCLNGYTGSCRTFGPGTAYGLGALGRNQAGMLADLSLVPRADHMMVKLPDGVAPETAASAADNIPDAWRTVAPHLERTPGAEVLIVGGAAEGIPFYALDIALALGASKVDYLDTDQRRLDLAKSLGANVIDSAPPKRAGSYPITVDASGDVAGLHCAVRSTEPEGVCTSVAIYFSETTPLPMLDMYSRGITFKVGRVHARAAMPAVLDLIASGRIHPERVTRTVAPWADAAEALAHHTGKTVITRAD